MLEAEEFALSEQRGFHVDDINVIIRNNMITHRDSPSFNRPKSSFRS
jgi:hypothetical protein